MTDMTEKEQELYDEICAVSFEMISAVGTATSKYMEAVEEAKDGNFEAADRLMKEGDEASIEGHRIHVDVIQKEGSGIRLPFILVLLHAEDQMMRTEITKSMAESLIDVYRKMGEKQEDAGT